MGVLHYICIPCPLLIIVNKTGVVEDAKASGVHCLHVRLHNV